MAFQRILEVVLTEGFADGNAGNLKDPAEIGQHADRYLVTMAHNDIHKENEKTIIRALDEPDFYELAYPRPLARLQFSVRSFCIRHHR